MTTAPLSVYRAAALARLARLFGKNSDPYAPLPAGTALSPSLGAQAAMAAAPRALAFDGDPAIDPAGWQNRARAKLADLAGYRTHRQPPSVTTERPERPLGGGLVKRSFYLRIRDETDLPVHLIYKSGLSSPAPVFLHLAGSTSGVHLAWGETRVPIDHQRLSLGADMARQAAEQGYLGVAIEQAGYGERGERHLAKCSKNRTIDLANHLLLLGRTLTGDGATDVSSAIDWLLGDACPVAADRDRIFLFGHSAGGTLAQFAAALDTRIGGVLASGSVGPIRETLGGRGAGGGDGIVPGILNWFETQDLIALVAPRVFVGLSGTRDHIFPYSGVEKAVEAARPFYRKLGADAAVQAVAVDGPHQYYAAASWAAWRAHIRPDQD
ncbi:MAG: hypothetical protein RIM72_13795 [Alphaproteobacteria bacterium]